jgi:8-amino-7-oxononanoate synthase
VPIQENRSTSVRIDGKDYVYFGGTNYLGLSRRPELLHAGSAAFEKYGFSAGASRVTSGESDLLLALEKDLAEFALSEAALVLPAGYMSNSMVVDGIEDLVDAWVILSNAHTSIKAPLKQSVKPVITHTADVGETSIRERHNLSAEARLGFVVEPIDPLTGHLFDVRTLLPHLRDNDFLVLDEAHSFGVLGKGGKGALEHFSLSKAGNLVRTGTFSKAIGTYGGFILASNDVLALIKQKSGAYKASTVLSPVVAGATREALRILQEEKPSAVDHLHENINFLNSALCDLGFNQYQENCVPIYHLPNSPAVARLREELPSRGIYMPTVTSYFADFCLIGLRWTIQSGHTHEHFEFLVSELSRHLSPAKKPG